MKKDKTRICKNCKWWYPYNANRYTGIWGDCPRRVPQYNIRFNDHCKNFEEKNND